MGSLLILMNLAEKCNHMLPSLHSSGCRWLFTFPLKDQIVMLFEHGREVEPEPV